MVPDTSKAKFVADIHVNVKKHTREWTNRKEKAVPAGAWTPGCGPWTLTNVMQVETELFLSPLAPRFPETTWSRKVEKTEHGWRLQLTPKSSSVNAISGFFLKPSLTRIDLAVGRKGIPTGATLGLEQGPIKDEGKVTFKFVDFAGEKRIEEIRSTLTSANLAIHPVLRFRFAKHKGFLLTDQVIFAVPSGDLSPTMGRTLGGMSMMSGLLFTDYKVKGKKARERRK